MIRSARPYALALTLTLAVSLARADVVRQALAPGVVFIQETLAPPDGPLLANVLRVDPKAPGVRVQAALGRDVVITDDPTHGRETVAPLAARHGALAAVNADFFPFRGDPINIAIRDGELLHESLPYRAAMAILPDGQVRFDTLLTVGRLMSADGTVYGLDGLNRPVGQDEIVALSPSYGDKTRAPRAATVVTLSGVNLPLKLGQDQTGTVAQVGAGDPDAPMPAGGAVLVGSGRGGEWLRNRLHPGDTVRFRFDCVSNPLPPGPARRALPSRAALLARPLKSVWTDAQQAVGGGPWVVRDGKVMVDGEEESFREAGFVGGRHPRTAVGVTASREILIVTVDGRRPGLSRGMTLRELGEYMVRQGAVQAINLDGGGSTQMVVRGAYVNYPSDDEPRPVADALLVYGPADGPRDAHDAPQAPAPSVDAPPVTLRAGERLALAPPAGVSGGPSGAPSPGVYGTLEGTGFVSQQGVLTSRRASPGTAVYRTSTGTVRIPYTVLAGPPASLKAAIGPAANNPPDRNNLTIVVKDAYGNLVSGQAVHIQATGGTPEQTDPVTDAAGRVMLEIVWDVTKGRQVVVSCGAKAVTVRAK